MYDILRWIAQALAEVPGGILVRTRASEAGRLLLMLVDPEGQFVSEKKINRA